jgi:hypothetical protein
LGASVAAVYKLLFNGKDIRMVVLHMKSCIYEKHKLKVISFNDAEMRVLNFPTLLIACVLVELWYCQSVIHLNSKLNSEILKYVSLKEFHYPTEVRVKRLEVSELSNSETEAFKHTDERVKPCIIVLLCHKPTVKQVANRHIKRKETVHLTYVRDY